MSARDRGRDLVERLGRLADVALTPGAVAAVRRTRPFSVAAFRLVRSLAAAGLDPSIVLDVGANRGQFAAAALEQWHRAQVISFEPLPGPAKKLRAISDRRLTVHQVALGRAEGTVHIHEHDYSASSSILRSIDPASTNPRTHPVPLLTLDGALAGTAIDRWSTLLKIDVQGYELEVLGGATGSLARIDAVVVEQALVATYVDQPLFDEVHQHMHQLGFSLTQLIDWRRIAGQVIEVDCLYRPQRGLRPIPT